MREALLLCDSCCGDCGKNERVFQMNTAALALAATFALKSPLMADATVNRKKRAKMKFSDLQKTMRFLWRFYAWQHWAGPAHWGHENSGPWFGRRWRLPAVELQLP
ncbi:MAG: hypothetical protein IPJ12_04200 [Betaproteobacteria bacterium]|nr:hypothetical protein [Betaproteobacteria bacterium]